jgi:hypothetical protein
MKKLKAEMLNPCHWALAGKTAAGSYEVANRDLGKVEIDCHRQLRRRSKIGESANQMSGSERVKS